MAVTKGKSRTGGRSARIQASVHAAVDLLLTEFQRSELTVPLIAERAGVTPSTIYRRWGGLPELIADVALKRLRPVEDPAETGALAGDLEAWLEQFLEEMTTEVGRTILRDVFSSPIVLNGSNQCYEYVYDHIKIILDRARRDRRLDFDEDDVIDLIVAPVIFRIFFGNKPVELEYCKRVIAQFLENQPSAH